jgi:hypothetical protein
MRLNNLSRLYLTGMRGFLRVAIPLLLICGVFILIYLGNPALFNSITAGVNQHPVACCLFRWGALLSLILLWPYFVRKTGQRWGATSEQILVWQTEALRIGIWLIIFELLVCENIVSKAIHLLGGL